MQDQKQKKILSKFLKIEQIVLKIDFSNIFSKLKYFFSLRRIFKNNKDIDELIIQYPTLFEILFDISIKNFRKRSNGKLIFLVHDIEALRFKKDDEQYKKVEINRLSQADGLIVHSNNMKKWIQKEGVQVPITVLNVFDYINSSNLYERKYNKTVCYVGNLEKSKFLNKIDWKNFNSQLFVFGPNKDKVNLGDSVVYKGIYTPEELPNHLNYNFGLVWDGESIEECNGITGNYLKYNAPHKTSLYLSTGIPVIIWNKAAVADFIVKNKVGFTINNLNEIPIILKKITNEEYNIYQKNAINLASKLRKGQMIKSSLNDLENIIKNN